MSSIESFEIAYNLLSTEIRIEECKGDVTSFKFFIGDKFNPFYTFHDAQKSVLYIHESELNFDTLIHEYSHLIVWTVEKNSIHEDNDDISQSNNFGCQSLIYSEDLEYYACCVEVLLRKNLFGEKKDCLAKRFFDLYEYYLDFKIDDHQYDDFVDEIFELGNTYLKNFDNIKRGIYEKK